MDPKAWNASEKEAFESVLGYLNFSSGDPAPQFLASLNILAVRLDERDGENTLLPSWRRLGAALWDYLKWVQPQSEVFARDLQVRQVLLFGLLYFFPQYRVWHKDLLFHQKDDTLFNPFSFGQAFYSILKTRAFESIPAEKADIASSDRFLDMTGSSEEMSPEIQVAVRRAIADYDDFIGYRPIPVLHSRQKMQPYRHEWVHAVPLYVRGAGVAHCRYAPIVSRMLEILKSTDDSLLHDAMFDMDHLEELTFDPRALDFEHPVIRRLNYHFGSWDGLHITNKGFYDRFVLIESTLESIFSRVSESFSKEHKIDRDELLFEASAVLGGTLLMGSAVCGWGPGARTSSDTFAVLLPKVAKIRDSFYQQLLEKVSGKHSDRLREEEKVLHQPFAGARQYFNRKLAKQRAEQYQNVQMARLYAWMGYAEASNEMVLKVNVPSSRMRCEVDCLLTKAHLDIDHGKTLEAIPKLYRIEEILHEGIECGAFIDPWYILGFDGQFPLASSVEDSTQDQRVDEMTSLIGSILSLYSRILKETAAKGFKKEQSELMFRMQEIAQWWDQFGTLELSEVNSVSGAETCESIQLVVNALEAWYEGGTAAGDIKFWRPRVVDFNSPKAYMLLIEALLDQKDPVASMALLINWLSQSEIFKLDDGDYSFHPLALRWMEDLWYPPTREQRIFCRRGSQLSDGWNLAKRFVDMVEANADIYGVVPSLDLESGSKKKSKDSNAQGMRDSLEEGLEETEISENEFGEEELEEIFDAAWENVIYHDSTDDGIDNSMMDGESLKHAMEDFPLNSEMNRISDRLLFIITQARLWKMSAVFSIPFAKEHAERAEVLQEWSRQADVHLEGLNRLIQDVDKFQVEKPDFSRPIAMMEYEKQISMKYSLLERLVSTCSELLDAKRLMRIADVENRILETDTWEDAARSVIQALICEDPQHVKKIWSKTLDLMAQEPILYAPIDRGGSPIQMIAIRSILTVIQRLLINLPIQGLLEETFQVLECVQEMERRHYIGSRAITRYDHLFDLGSKGILRSILKSGNKPGRMKWKINTLIPLLDEMIGILLQNWISHSHGIRISSLDPFHDPKEWKQLRDFIKKYGEDLFSPVLMNYSNLQAIHHEGIASWLESLRENCEEKENSAMLGEDSIQGEKLIRDLEENRISENRARGYLDTIVETLLERYGQFIDYNTTTTQSDNGSNLFMLFDFLRLLGEYDRMAWDMRPFINAHKIMVYEKNYEVADSWCESIEERSGFHAKRFIRRYRKLCLKYGLTIKTVGDRLDERLVKPMAINKLCALLEPSIQEARAGGETPSFERLLELVKEFIAEPTGTGYEPPTWLEEIENEINRYRNRSEDDDEMLDLKDFIPRRLLTKNEIEKIIHSMRQNESLDHILDKKKEKILQEINGNIDDEFLQNMIHSEFDPELLDEFIQKMSVIMAGEGIFPESVEELEENESGTVDNSDSRSRKGRNDSESDEDEEFRKLFE